MSVTTFARGIAGSRRLARILPFSAAMREPEASIPGSDSPLRRAWRERATLGSGLEGSARQRRFLDYATIAVEKRLNVEEIARDIHVSPRRLHQLCHRWFGLPPKIVLEVRTCESIEHAMLTTRSSLAEIARQHGFKQPGALNRFFKRVSGETPGRYRARFGADPAGSASAPGLPNLPMVPPRERA